MHELFLMHALQISILKYLPKHKYLIYSIQYTILGLDDGTMVFLFYLTIYYILTNLLFADSAKHARDLTRRKERDPYSYLESSEPGIPVSRNKINRRRLAGKPRRSQVPAKRTNDSSSEGISVTLNKTSLILENRYSIAKFNLQKSRVTHSHLKIWPHFRLTNLSIYLYNLEICVC